jgi:hypothetical protein
MNLSCGLSVRWHRTKGESGLWLNMGDKHDAGLLMIYMCVCGLMGWLGTE